MSVCNCLLDDERPADWTQMHNLSHTCHVESSVLFCFGLLASPMRSLQCLHGPAKIRQRHYRAPASLLLMQALPWMFRAFRACKVYKAVLICMSVPGPLHQDPCSLK